MAADHDRHRSLRSTLDWSYALLDEPDQAVLRRVSVFAARSPPRGGGHLRRLAAGGSRRLPTIFAGLADQSLLVAIADPSGTRYRARRPSASTAPTAGRRRRAGRGTIPHLSWCLAPPRGLELPRPAMTAVPGGGFDEVAVDLGGAALGSRRRAGTARQAYRLAIRLAELSFARGMPGESQRRYEQAAGSPPTTAPRPPRCAAPRAPRRPGISATRPCGCVAPRPTQRYARVTGPARPWTSPGPPS